MVEGKTTGTLVATGGDDAIADAEEAVAGGEEAVTAGGGEGLLGLAGMAGLGGSSTVGLALSRSRPASAGWITEGGMATFRVKVA